MGSFALRGHTEVVNSVCFDSTGRRLASGSTDETVKIWDALTGRELFSLEGRTGTALSVAFSPDG